MGNSRDEEPASALGDFQAFAKERQGLKDKVAGFYVYWVGRFIGYCGGGIDSGRVGPFLDGLATDLNPWQVDQADKAIRLFLFFWSCRTAKTARAPDPSARAAWVVAIDELVRMLRLHHLSLRTERTYVAWIERLMDFVATSNQPKSGPRMYSAF